MNYHLLLEEDKKLPIHEVRKLVRPKISRRLFKELLKKLVKDLSRAVREKRILFNKIYRVKLEARPPCIISDFEGLKLYTGQWVGIIQYSLGMKGPSLTLEIEPKYDDFHLMYQEVVKKLKEDDFKPLGQLTLSLPLSTVKPVRDIRLALWLLEQYLDTTPPYLYIEGEGAVGHRLKKVTPQPRLAFTMIKINEELYSTAAVSTALIAKTLKGDVPVESKKLKGLMEVHIKEQQELLGTLLARPLIREAMIRTPEIEPNLDICLMIREALTATPSPIGKGLSRLLLIPTIKTYELYVLLKTIEALGGLLDVRSLHIIKTKKATLYYNRPPKRLSRFIYKLSRSVPHP
ncbi:MAG: hypothetical protein DRJ33_08265, partial [Candidatus Methanomethylicota archaeon]